MAKRPKNSSLRIELARGAIVLALSSALGFTINALSAHPIAIFAGEAQAKAAVPRISVSELNAAMKRNDLVLVVDVRDEANYDTGHVPLSLHAPLDAILRGERDILGTLQAAEKSGAAIVTLCDSEQCEKSDQAAEALLKLGYKNVRVLQGGYQAYYESGAPIEGANR